MLAVPAAVSDPVGIQTQDLQNRNLTLYSAKLRGLCVFSSGAKLIKKIVTGRFVEIFFRSMSK